MQMSKENQNWNNFSFFLFSSLLIGILFCLVTYQFISVSSFSEGSTWADAYLYAFSYFNYTLFILIGGLFFYIFSLLGLKRTSKILFLVVAGAFFTYFVADSFVFKQFRMHLNFAMLEMALLGRGQFVEFTFEMLVQVLIYILLCFLTVFCCGYIASKFFKTTAKVNASVVATLILGFISCQLIYGIGFAKQNPEITQVRQVLPLIRPLRFNKLLVKLGIVTPEEIYSVSLPGKKAKMNYPLSELNCKGGSRYNIVFLFVDALRYDMVTKEIMPNVYEFSKNSVVFKNHYSGGINTRHGIFTLFTGIPGNYWDTSLQTKSGSALIKALQARDYEIGIFTGAPITMPEFNQTVFATIADPRLESQGKDSIERDENAIKDFEAWLTSIPKSKKFFSFVFLDNVHAAVFPEDKENTVFKPYWKTVNQLELNNDFDPLPYLNRYKNSVHYADKQLGRILKNLRDHIDLLKTIIVISSDHGEEFNDNKQNYWGHNGNFTKYQAQVPFIVKWPGKGNVEIEYATSMLDVVPTILPEVLGCSNPVSDYSVGENLFSPSKDREYRYVSNYSKDAFIEKDRIVLINEVGLLNYLDENNRPSSNKEIPSYLKKVLEETSRFLK